MKRVIILFCCCSLLVIGVQCKAAYKMKMTRAEVARFNDQYMEGRLWITKPDRYTNAVNCELIVHDMPSDTKVKLKMHEFLSNEYRPFAINLERRLSTFLALDYKMMFYPDYVRLGAHMPEPRCPVIPGNYSFANVTPNVNDLPPSLPFRNFMMTIEFWHGAVEMILLKFYGTFDRDAVIREQYG